MVSSIYQLVCHMQQKHGTKTAFQYFEDDQLVQVNYQEYTSAIRHFASYLIETYPNIQDKKIAVIARNSYAYMVCLLGVMLSGAVVIPLNREESWENLQYEIEFSETSLIYSDAEYLEKEPQFAEKYADMLQNVNTCVTHTEETELKDCPDTSKMAMLIFTSGTTGVSKGTMLAQKTIFGPLKIFGMSQEDRKAIFAGTYTGGKRVFFVLPMYHAFGLSFALSTGYAGDVLNLCTDLKNMYHDLKEMGCDYTAVVPMYMDMWRKDIRRGRQHRLGDMKTIWFAGAKANPDTVMELEAHGIKVVSHYGLSETIGKGFNDWEVSKHEFKSVGQADEGVQAKLVDGEVCMKGDCIALGYYKNQEATDQVMIDGWFHTGDLGYMDEENNLYLTGRKKNLIILASGENVSAEELEILLVKNMDITEVVVKEKQGKICAEIFCLPEKQEEIKAFVAQVNSTLAYYKHISRVDFVDQPFAKTATGKIKRI